MSRFIMFSIGKNFAKTVNEYFAGKTVIKWELLKDKNLNNQYEILFEYEEVKESLIDIMQKGEKERCQNLH